MFEELCRKQGTLLIPTGEYEDSLPKTEEIPVRYFAMDKTYRNEHGLHLETQYYVKGYGKAAPSGCQLILEEGSVIDAGSVEFLFNHFDNTPEFNVITPVHE